MAFTKRYRDVGGVTFTKSSGGSAAAVAFGCVNSAGFALGSDVLRASCSYAISERYQGLTNLSLEITIESTDPFINIHPGDKGELVVLLPSAPTDTGLPGEALSITIDSCVCTTHSGRAEKDALGSGTYVFRAQSSDGVGAPLSLAEEVALGDAVGGPSSFIRDISDFTFTPSGDGEVMDTDAYCPRSFEFSEQSTLIEDGCQGSLWPTYVGITGLNTTVSTTGRGVYHALTELGPTIGGANPGLGLKGDVSFGVDTGSDTSCVATEAGGTAVINHANVNAVNITATAGAIAEATVSWTGHGEAGELADPTKRAIVEYTSA